MNIEDLTIKQARELAALFSAQTVPQNHPMIGKHVIIRTYSAGVHFGVLTAKNGTDVILSSARRIWSWTGAFSLTEVALVGISGGKLSSTIAEIALTQAVEIIPITPEAQTCLNKISAVKI